MHIPDYVSNNSNLSANAKVLYGYILANCEENVCIKDNTYFSALMNGVADRTIRNYLKELKTAGLIEQINYGRVKNAIFVLHDDSSSQKIDISSLSNILCSTLEKFFQDAEKAEQFMKILNPILSITDELNNLVLVSKEDKNIYNNSARVRERVDSSQQIASVSTNVNKFSNYETAGSAERVKEFNYNDRLSYTNVLFDEFFTTVPQSYMQGQLYNAGLEVVDNMIEAFNQAQTKRGFIFDARRYDKNRLLDAYFNITSQEFWRVVQNIAGNDEIKARSPYIMGAILQCGNKPSWKKTYELVKKGYPWDCHVPSSQPLQDIFFISQQRVEQERQRSQFEQEYRRKNTC